MEQHTLRSANKATFIKKSLAAAKSRHCCAQWAAVRVLFCHKKKQTKKALLKVSSHPLSDSAELLESDWTKHWGLDVLLDCDHDIWYLDNSDNTAICNQEDNYND